MEFLFMASSNGLSVPKINRHITKPTTTKHNIFSVAAIKPKTISIPKIRIGANGFIEKQ